MEDGKEEIGRKGEGKEREMKSNKIKWRNWKGTIMKKVKGKFRKKKKKTDSESEVYGNKEKKKLKRESN